MYFIQRDILKLKNKLLHYYINLLDINIMDSDEKTIIDIWKRNNLVGVTKLNEILREGGYNFNRKYVNEVIKKQKTSQLHKMFKRDRKKLGHIIAYKENENIQIDLADMSQYSHKNSGYKYILLAIDIFSRKVYAEPLKTKSESEVTKAFEKIISENDVTPKVVSSDNGSEFTNRNFKKLLNENEITQKTNMIGDHNSLGIIDRFTRTLKDIIHKHFTEYNTTKWINQLENFIRIYNESPHRGLNYYSPNQVNENSEKIFKYNLEKLNKNINIDYKISVGDNVRVLVRKNVFTKGYIPTWSDEIYKVKMINSTKAILNDNEGNEFHYRVDELQKISDGQTNINKNVKPSQLKITLKEIKAIRDFNSEGLDKNDIIENRVSTRQTTNKRVSKPIERFQAGSS